MRFTNREHAGRLLAGRLAVYRGQHPLVLAVPRGAVPMARLIADLLGGELDVVLVRKLRAPGRPELAIGAVDEDGAILKGGYFDIASREYFQKEVRAQREILRTRRALYTQARSAVDPAGRVVIIVDDGIATGASMLAAIGSVRERRPRKLVVAVAVAPPGSLASIWDAADEVVCLYSPENFHAVGQFFDEFSEVTDDMVVAALARAEATAGASTTRHAAPA